MPMCFVQVYYDFLPSLEPLSDAERGRLFTALLEYASQGTAPDLRGNERYVWPQLKSQIDRDSKKYIEISRSRSEAGKRGRLAKAGKGKQKKQMPAIAGKSCQEEDKEEEKEKDEEEKKDTFPQPPRGAKECDKKFAEFWREYPRKVGKSEAAKSFFKLHVTDDLLSTMISALQAQKANPDWLRENGRYIPYPSTWLNQKRWEDELEDIDQAKPVEWEEY